MGFFSKLLGSEGNAPVTFTKEEGFMGILLAAIAVDGHLDQAEIADFHSLVLKANILKNISDSQFNKSIDKVVKTLKKDGIQTLVDLSVAVLPEQIAAGTFAMVCDLLFSDGYIDKDEEKLLEQLKGLLSISDADAEKIVSVIAMKNKV